MADRSAGPAAESPLDEKVKIVDARIIGFFLVDNLFVDKGQRHCGKAASSLYVTICRHANAQGTASLSIRELIKETGMVSHTVQDGLRLLEKYHLIAIDRAEGKAGEYRILDKSFWNLPDSVEKSVENTVGVALTATVGVALTATVGVALTATPPPPIHICTTSTKRKDKTKDLKTSVAGSCDLLACPARLAARLFNEICKNNPKIRLLQFSEMRRNASIQRWAVDIDLLMRVDRQQPSTVEEVIVWATRDVDFWGSNILSGRKLRKHWDTLVAQMKRRVSHQAHSGACSPPPTPAHRPPMRNIFRTKSGWKERLPDGTAVPIAEADLPKRKTDPAESVVGKLAAKMGEGVR